MRYKEYNRNRILGICLKLFWKQGFYATSIRQLVEATGGNRFSLYAEFNNKQGILHSAIQLYLQRMARPNLQILEDAAADMASLIAFFNSFLIRKDNFPRGCFLIYVSTELGTRDEHVNRFLSDYLAVLNQAFSHWARRRKLKNQTAIADHLMGLYCSAMCYGIILSKPDMEAYLNQNLRVILKGGYHA